jgi:hypothetical protein
MVPHQKCPNKAEYLALFGIHSGADVAKKLERLSSSSLRRTKRPLPVSRAPAVAPNATD